jgi:hypothetical protein
MRHRPASETPASSSAVTLPVATLASNGIAFDFSFIPSGARACRAGSPSRKAAQMRGLAIRRQPRALGDAPSGGSVGTRPVLGARRDAWRLLAGLGITRRGDERGDLPCNQNEKFACASRT